MYLKATNCSNYLKYVEKIRNNKSIISILFGVGIYLVGMFWGLPDDTGQSALIFISWAGSDNVVNLNTLFINGYYFYMLVPIFLIISLSWCFMINSINDMIETGIGIALFTYVIIYAIVSIYFSSKMIFPSICLLVSIISIGFALGWNKTDKSRSRI